MSIESIRYRFRQNFQVPARDAFAWCTDFVPEDKALLPPDVRRTVRKIAPNALILKDVRGTKRGRVEISRLVRIDPDTLSWTNTHITGPFVHSQFWYQVLPDGPRRSHLEFRGLRLARYPRRLTSQQLARATEEERRGDQKLWRVRLAPALHADLKAARR